MSINFKVTAFLSWDILYHIRTEFLIYAIISFFIFILLVDIHKVNIFTAL
jgi:hypothetical protein